MSHEYTRGSFWFRVQKTEMLVGLSVQLNKQAVGTNLQGQNLGSSGIFPFFFLTTASVLVWFCVCLFFPCVIWNLRKELGFLFCFFVFCFFCFFVCFVFFPVSTEAGLNKSLKVVTWVMFWNFFVLCRFFLWLILEAFLSGSQSDWLVTEGM